ncbi:hypothetical protein FZZ92_07435 [Synechococcus sp. MU1611]|nr:hypothetical protein [Synechococcus sp. MU1611]
MKKTIGLSNDFWLVVFICLLIALWPITLALGCAAAIILVLISISNGIHSGNARLWQKENSGKPCSYSGQFGFIERASHDGNKVTLSIMPIRALLPDSSPPLATYTTKFIEGSFQKTMNKLFKDNSIELLDGISVSLAAIESALKCQEHMIWCNRSLGSIGKMSKKVNQALQIADGNPLLEPSIPALEATKSRITSESSSLKKAKKFALETLSDLIEYLSVPEELRDPSMIGSLSDAIAIQNDELKKSFKELVEFNNEYIKLMQ